jgi:hypothetical protein
MPSPPYRAALAAAAFVCLVLAPATASAAETDFATNRLNILPSGQQGSVPVPANADRQARMFDALTPGFDDITKADLQRDFKSEHFGTRGQCPCKVEKVPRSGVRLVRDRFDVPHITQADANKERISFVPGLLKTTLRYANRPTGIQQVISFKGHRPER